MTDDLEMDPIEGQKESDAIVSLIMEAVGKIPSKVVLIASGKSFDDTKIPIGSITTRICGVQSMAFRVMVTFKEPVWGSRVHEACQHNGKLYFPLERKLGWGLDPEFIIQTH